MSTPVLVGDIGGTHCRLALATVEGQRVHLSRQAYLKNSEADGLSALVRKFLGDADTPRLACLAVAGPTDGQSVRFTNLDWHIDAGSLQAEFGFERASLINDFLAVGYGLDAVDTADLATLQAGRRQARAPRIAIGAGTGLGVAQSIWDGAAYQALASEGGHMAFAPLDDEQASLLRFLQPDYGRVSVERLLSGSGIVNLYRFCRAASGRPLKRAREPAEITAAALEGSDPTAVWAMRLFSRIYGQTAGDLALIAQASGGVYLAGGIPPKVLPFLEGEEFLAGFRGKGRFSDWTGTVPIQVVLDKDVGMKGAALRAARL